MKVRDFILVSHVPNGGLDVPLVFELEQEEAETICRYLELHFCGRLPSDDICEAAQRLAERGIPQGIEELVIQELRRRGRVLAVNVDSFPCPHSKVAS